MDMKIVGISVTVLVSLVVLAGVLMPVLDDATTVEEKFTNEGLYRMSAYDTTATISASWDHTDPFAITINGEKIALPDTLQTVDMTLFGCDEFLIRYNAGTNPYIQAYYGNSSSVTANVNNGTDMTISIASGTASISNGTQSGSPTYASTLYVCDNDGDLVMKPYNKDAYVLGDSEIYATGRSYVLSTNFTTVLSGTIDDGIDREYWPDSSVSDWTFSDITENYTKVDGFKNLYKFTSFSWTATNASNQSANITYSQVIVPYEITAEKSVHLTEGQNQLLLVIPVLVIVAILLGVIAMVIRSRLD